MSLTIFFSIWAVLCFAALGFMYCASVVSNPSRTIEEGEAKATRQWRNNKAKQYARRWRK